MERYFINQINNSDVVIGGVRVLSEFSPEVVTVSVPGGQVRLTGTGLKIARFDENEIEVVGKIANVETVSHGKRKI